MDTPDEKQRPKKVMPISPGRPKGKPNRTTTLLKDAILLAAEELGGADGLVGFFKAHAVTYPVAFLSLVAKILPYQISGVDGEAIKTEHHATIDASLLDQDQRDELRRLLLAATPAIG